MIKDEQIISFFFPLFSQPSLLSLMGKTANVLLWELNPLSHVYHWLQAKYKTFLENFLPLGITIMVKGEQMAFSLPHLIYSALSFPSSILLYFGSLFCTLDQRKADIIVHFL